MRIVLDTEPCFLELNVRLWRWMRSCRSIYTIFLSNPTVDVRNNLCKGMVWPLFTSRGLAAVRFSLTACKRQVLRALFNSFQTDIFPTHDTVFLNRKWTMLKNHKVSSILSDDDTLKSTSAKTTRQRAFRFYFACYPYPNVWVVLVL